MALQNFSYLQVQELLVQSLFQEQEIIPKISSFIDTNDFTDENYKIIYSALLSLQEQDRKIKLSEIYEWINNKGEVINNLEIWTKLSAPVFESPVTLAEILKRQSIQHKTKELLKETTDKLLLDSPQTLEIISETETKLNTLATSLIVKKDEKTLSENMDDLLEYVFRNEPEDIDTIPLFNNSMSEVLNNGWRPEQMIVVGARTGVGKSVFAVDSTVAACNSNRSVLFFSLEMSEREVATRLLSVQSDVILNKLKPGRERSKEEEKRIIEASNQIKDWKLEINDTPGQTIESIKAISKLKAMSPEGLDMIIIDYLQLITPSNTYGKSRQDQVAEISREIKLLAKTLKVPVMVLVQLKRATKTSDGSEDELPTKDEIRESGAIAQDADVVLLIHRRKNDKQDEVDPKALFIVDKNRGGQAPKLFTVRCALEKSAFRDIDKEEILEDELDIKEIKDLTDNSFLNQSNFENEENTTFAIETDDDDSLFDDLF